jgi:phospholipid-binding lipoprotein MlaA
MRRFIFNLLKKNRVAFLFGLFFLSGGQAFAAHKTPCSSSSCCKPLKLPKVRKTEIRDDFETLNRSIFAFNHILDRLLFSPLAYTYRHTTPTFLRKGIHNALQNVATPVTILNCLIQNKPEQAWEAAVRLLINTVFGLGGLVDVAAAGGLTLKPEDFGKTLGYYGVGEGGYVVLPILGPSCVRDALGRAVDWIASPFNVAMMHADHQNISYVLTGAHLIDIRERNIESIENIEKSSVDFYAAVRSLYHQHRAFEIRKSKKSSSEEETFGDEVDEEGPMPSTHLDFEEDY